MITPLVVCRFDCVSDWTRDSRGTSQSKLASDRGGGGGEGGVLSFKVVPRLRQIQNLLAGFIVCKFTYWPRLCYESVQVIKSIFTLALHVGCFTPIANGSRPKEPTWEAVRGAACWLQPMWIFVSKHFHMISEHQKQRHESLDHWSEWSSDLANFQSTGPKC